jgi:1-deoxyxylulose-5-phosphate synthase
MSLITRRSFLKTGVATGALAGMGGMPLLAERAAATDRITLGRTDVKVTRLAFGTGTHNGQVQRQLGQDAFNRMVRHAYDQGIRFFETAQSYPGMPEMLGTALKGIPRDSYALMSKVTTDGADPRTTFDEMRRQSQTEFFDIMLMHVQTGPNWPSQSLRWQDGILEMEHRQAIRSHGASVHGLQALHQVPGDKWLEIAMIRMNHKGTRMDNENDDWEEPGNVSDVVEHVKQAHAAGKGVISMKLIGEGAFTDRSDRQQAMRFAFRNAGVDAVTVGYKSIAEIDEAIENVNLALA